LTERSRAGELGWPRKYFWATMFVAFCDHVVGNSTSACSNAAAIAERPALGAAALRRRPLPLAEVVPIIV